MTLRIRVVPGARRTEVAGERDGYLRVRVAAPAREGRANLELIRYLAARAGVPRSQVEIVAGVASRRKLVRVLDVDPVRLQDELCRSI